MRQQPGFTSPADSADRRDLRLAGGWIALVLLAGVIANIVAAARIAGS